MKDLGHCENVREAAHANASRYGDRVVDEALGEVVDAASLDDALGSAMKDSKSLRERPSEVRRRERRHAPQRYLLPSLLENGGIYGTRLFAAKRPDCAARGDKATKSAHEPGVDVL